MLDMPLANKIGTPESYAHRTDQQRFRSLEAAAGSGGAALNWRVAGWPHYRPVLAGVLLEHGNPRYQLLDYERIEQLMRRERITAAQARARYGALTAAIWLGESEDRRPITRHAPAPTGTPAA